MPLSRKVSKCNTGLAMLCFVILAGACRVSQAGDELRSLVDRACACRSGDPCERELSEAGRAWVRRNKDVRSRDTAFGDSAARLLENNCSEAGAVVADAMRDEANLVRASDAPQ